MADFTEIVHSGDSCSRIDIIIVAEGYTVAERAKFLSDAVVNQALAFLSFDYDRYLTIVLIRSEKYGGALGSVAWTTSENCYSYGIAVHEIGYSVAGLSDEYVDTGFRGGSPIASSPNVSALSDPCQLNWSEWVGFVDPLGTVGVYEGGYHRAEVVWRATQAELGRLSCVRVLWEQVLSALDVAGSLFLSPIVMVPSTTARLPSFSRKAVVKMGRGRGL